MGKSIGISAIGISDYVSSLRNGKANGQNIIGHRNALQLLLSSMVLERLNDNTRAELPAIISHWLQSPDEPPRIIPDYGEKWKAILSSYVGASLEDMPISKVPPPRTQRKFKVDFSSVPFGPVEKPAFTFVDLFAGIGGFRIALQNLGGKCVFSSEWDRPAKETYFANFGEIPFGDITFFTPSNGKSTGVFKDWLPEHTILDLPPNVEPMQS